MKIKLKSTTLITGKTRLAVAMLLPLVLTACSSVSPIAYTKQEISERVDNDLMSMYSDHEPVTAPLTFYDVAARALKYNLDYKLKLMEGALSESLYQVSTFEMLPRLVAGAGYASRNNDSGGTSIGIDDGQQSLRPSTSQERDRTLGNLTFSWNALDFGVSYYRAQQKADQVLMAEERRRKVVQNVLQDVRNSYWRAVGAQRLIHRVDTLLERAHKALAQAKDVEQQALKPKVEILAYQRALLDAVSLLTLRRQDLELAKAELNALMSVAPGQEYTLAEETETQLFPVNGDISQLEKLALELRPELMEEWYRKRITENDIKAAKILLWPNISLDTGLNYDSNKYSYNNSWSESGVRISWNLLKLTQLPALRRAHDFQNQTDDMRRKALSMAVMTQVRVGTQRYNLTLEELRFAEESMRVDQSLLAYTKASATSKFESELELIRSEARALLAEYQRYVAYSNAQAAFGRVYNSIGLDVMPENIESHDLSQLAESIRVTLEQWQVVTLGPKA